MPHPTRQPSKQHELHTALPAALLLAVPPVPSKPQAPVLYLSHTPGAVRPHLAYVACGVQPLPEVALDDILHTQQQTHQTQQTHNQYDSERCSILPNTPSKPPPASTATNNLILHTAHYHQQKSPTHTLTHTHTLTCSAVRRPSSNPLPLILLRSSVTTPYCCCSAASYSGGRGKGKAARGPCADLWLLGCQWVDAWWATPPASGPGVPLYKGGGRLGAAGSSRGQQTAAVSKARQSSIKTCDQLLLAPSSSPVPLPAFAVTPLTQVPRTQAASQKPPTSKPQKTTPSPEGHHKGEELLRRQQQHRLGRGSTTPTLRAAAATMRVRAARRGRARPRPLLQHTPATTAAPAAAPSTSA